MKEIILVKDGEIALKGLNRRTFEDILIKNIRHRIADLGPFEIRSAQSTIYVTPLSEGIDLEEAVERIRKVFGIACFSRACVTEKDMDAINRAAAEYLAEELESVSTFKVEAKRSDKKFPFRSPDICMQTGGYLLEKYPHLTVDVHHPDVVVTVEVRDFGAYVRGGVQPGAGGIPVGSSGHAAVLISGGIDSPVAAYMMAKRGLRLTAFHFASPPYTSERAEQKVCELLEKVSEYSGGIRMLTVPFTKIQEQIREHCPEELFTIIMRRVMVKISNRLAQKFACTALITGESLGQVASQTIHAIACTDAAAELPVFRPLIGMDKDEIIAISRKIDTFDISIQPYEDCCTVFTPRHPRTKPVLKFVEQAESKVDWEPLIEEAVENVSLTKIGYREKL